LEEQKWKEKFEERLLILEKSPGPTAPPSKLGINNADWGLFIAEKKLGLAAGHLIKAMFSGEELRESSVAGRKDGLRKLDSNKVLLIEGS